MVLIEAASDPLLISSTTSAVQGLGHEDAKQPGPQQCMLFPLLHANCVHK